MNKIFNPYVINIIVVPFYLQKDTKSNAKPVDLKMVDKGMPYFPFPNNPFKIVHKHNTNHKLQKTSKAPEPWLLPPRASGFSPKNAIARAMSWTNKTAVTSTKTGDSSKVNLPALASTSS